MMSARARSRDAARPRSTSAASSRILRVVMWLITKHDITKTRRRTKFFVFFAPS